MPRFKHEITWKALVAMACQDLANPKISIERKKYYDDLLLDLAEWKDADEEAQREQALKKQLGKSYAPKYETGDGTYLGDRIKQAIKLAWPIDKMTQKDLATLIEVTPSALSRWIAGTRQPPRDVLQRIAKITGVHYDFLIGKTDNTGKDED